MTFVALIIPSFLAGLLTFFAPCTLPLVPGYLGFVSGVSRTGAGGGVGHGKDLRKRVLWNAFLYTAGFTVVFVALGTLFGLGGLAFVANRVLLGRIGGVFIMLFGVFMIAAEHWPGLSFAGLERSFRFAVHLTPGRPASSLLFGAAFAFAWTPCIGPILGSALLLASSTGTILEGALLLFVYSLGIAVPFLVVAWGFGSFSEKFVAEISRYTPAISALGGAFLILLGYLLFTDQFGAWLTFFYQWFGFLQFPGLNDYL